MCMCIRPRAVRRECRDGVRAGSGRCCSQRSPVTHQRGQPLTDGNGLTSYRRVCSMALRRARRPGHFTQGPVCCPPWQGLPRQASGQDLWEVRRHRNSVFRDGHHCRPARGATLIPQRAESCPARHGGTGAASAVMALWADAPEEPQLFRHVAAHPPGVAWRDEPIRFESRLTR
jgi:hypothetical protein